MNIGFVAEFSAIIEFWSTPKGIKISLEKLGNNVIEFGFEDKRFQSILFLFCFNNSIAFEL